MRLHFAEPSTTTAGNRIFDILLNSTLVQDNYDVFAAAGDRYKATTLSFSTTASGGNGLLLELVNEDPSWRAILSAIEVTQANPSGVASPTVDVQLSRDGGATFTETLASGVALDRFGRGSFDWTVTGAETDQALVRVVSNDAVGVMDDSDEQFLVANNGTDYYVNDASLTNDEYTTAIGNNITAARVQTLPWPASGRY